MLVLRPLALLSFISTTLLHLTCQGQTTNNDHGTFEHPSAAYRPRFRYWLPDASVDGDVVKADIVAAASIGAGGVEFLPYYNYGGGYGAPPAGVNWSTYGFGTPPYLNVFRSAMEGHRETGTFMDFPLGPNQAQGVPAARDDEGLQWDLVPFSIIVPANGTFHGVIPGWGTGDLVALVSAHVLSESTISTFAPNISPETFPAILPNATFAQAQQAATPLQIIIQDGSLQDVTTIVGPNGSATFAAPANTTGLYYRLFAFYQRRTLNKNVSFQSNRSANIWDDGSYNVDHFSARGAETVTDFWEKYILVDGLEDLLKEVGNYGWEDSVEITSTVTWTPSLPARFEAKFGYPIYAYLPMMIYQQNNLLLQSNDPGEFQCLLDTPDKGVGYSNDYRGAIQDGYRDYLQALKNWTNNRLGKDYSAQPGYNLPLDMTSGIPVVDIPECESLSFHGNVDVYRQFVGSANLAGRNLISNEMGAEGNRAYSLYMTDLLSSITYAIAGGVNKFVIHGQPYSGKYPGTTWPGYTAFSYDYSEMWSPKQPSWENGLSDLLGYTSRLSFIQQLGVPLTDVALYNKPSATDPRLPPLYAPTDLTGGGWSYTYLSPEDFNLPHAYAKNGILAPDGPSWQAVAIQSNQNLSIDAVSHLQNFATAGVPIVISGGTPGYYSSGNDSSKPLFDKDLASLLSMSNVYQVGTGGVASKLASIGLEPRAQYSANGTWYTTFRSDPASNTEYVFVLNDSPNATVGEIVVQSAKTPYFMDAWAGEKVPILVYNSSSETTTIQLSLAGKQAKLIAFQDPSQSDDPACHVTSTDVYILGSNYSATSKSISLHAAGTGQATFSNGKIQNLNSSNIAQPITLSNSTLIAEHWERPSDLYDAGVIAVKRNTTHHLSSLTSWLNIPALSNVSGVGYYTATFTWSSNSSASGAYISLPSILHGGRAYVNGARIPPFDYFGALKDITPFLKEGNNEVRIVVPTTMWNYIRTFFDQLETPGIDNTRGSVEGLPPLDNGLIGNVVVVPFREIVFQC